MLHPLRKPLSSRPLASVLPAARPLTPTLSKLSPGTMCCASFRDISAIVFVAHGKRSWHSKITEPSDMLSIESRRRPSAPLAVERADDGLSSVATREGRGTIPFHRESSFPLTDSAAVCRSVRAWYSGCAWATRCPRARPMARPIGDVFRWRLPDVAPLAISFRVRPTAQIGAAKIRICLSKSSPQPAPRYPGAQSLSASPARPVRAP